MQTHYSQRKKKVPLQVFVHDNLWFERYAITSYLERILGDHRNTMALELPLNLSVIQECETKQSLLRVSRVNLYEVELVG